MRKECIHRICTLRTTYVVSYDVGLELRVASGGENSGRRMTIRQHEGSTMYADCRAELQRSRKNAMVIVLRSYRSIRSSCIQHNRTILIILALRRRWFFFKNGGCYRRTGTIPSQYKGWLVIHLAPCDCNGERCPKREIYSSILDNNEKKWELKINDRPASLLMIEGNIAMGNILNDDNSSNQKSILRYSQHKKDHTKLKSKWTNKIVSFEYRVLYCIDNTNYLVTLFNRYKTGGV